MTYVSDIVQGNLLAMEKDEMDYGIYNVGTGHALTVLDFAQALNHQLDSDQDPEIVHKFRAGDIRRLQALGYEPRVRFEVRTVSPSWSIGCARKRQGGGQL